MVDSSPAFPLHSIKYGDTSLITHCYTEKHGMHSFLLKGILGGKKKTLKKSIFQPLTPIEIVAQFKSNGTLGFIKEAKIISNYTTIPFDIRKKALLLFLSEMLYRILQEEPEPNAPLFAYIKQSFVWLDQNKAIGNFHLKFLLELTRYIGFYPNIESADALFFDLESGRTSHKLPTGPYLQGNLKTKWMELLGTNFDTCVTITANRFERNTLLNQVIVYFKLHLQRFSEPKSTAVLNEVFKDL